jgi:hypothetical protein
MGLHDRKKAEITFIQDSKFSPITEQLFLFLGIYFEIYNTFFYYEYMKLNSRPVTSKKDLKHYFEYYST